jgi:lipopolysaccharide export system permease protein
MKISQISRIDRYVFRQLLIALVAVTTGLVALIWLTQSLRFVDTVVNRGLSVSVFLRLTGLLIPNFVAVILPITCFVVVQFIYQRLVSDRELTVMRAAGLSQFALARPAMAIAGLTMVICLLLDLWLVPASFTQFRQFQFEIRNRLAAFLLQEGVFNTVSDNMTIYVRTRDADGTMRGIMIEDGRQPNNHATILAQSGRLVGGDSAPRVLLINGSRQELDRQSGRLNVLTFAENTIDLTQANTNSDQRSRDVGELSVEELLSSETPAQLSIGNQGKLKVEIHRRLTAPLTAVSFVMIALYASLTGSFQRHGGLLRPLVAVVAVVGLLALGLAVTNLAIRDTSLIPLLWLHAVLPGLAVFVALFGPELSDLPLRLPISAARN